MGPYVHRYFIPLVYPLCGESTYAAQSSQQNTVLIYLIFPVLSARQSQVSLKKLLTPYFTHYVGFLSHSMFRRRNQSLQDRSVFMPKRVGDVGQIAAERRVSSSEWCLDPCFYGLAGFLSSPLLQLVSLQACIRLTCCATTKHQYTFARTSTATTENTGNLCNTCVSLFGQSC